MAPITMTSVGVPRQIIDDPKLLDLLNRLSNFDATSSSTDTSSTTDASGVAVNDKDEGGNDDGDVTMVDAQESLPTAASSVEEGGISEHQTTSTATATKPPLDINGLVTELKNIPKWKFQEQVRNILIYCLFSL